jgi:hypothetical protein
MFMSIFKDRDKARRWKRDRDTEKGQINGKGQGHGQEHWQGHGH